MSAILNFDASQVAPDTGSQDAVPAGWYDVFMEASEMKPTKDGTGAFLECKFNIVQPQQYANKKIYSRLNLRNANATAQEIGYKQLSAICHATHVLQVSDSQMLHNIPLKVKVKLRKADGDYEASNEITAYKNINEVVGNAAQAAAPFAPAAPGFAPPAPPAFSAPAAPMAPPQQAAPQWTPPAAPQQAQPMQAPQQAAPQQWQPPAAQQPWQGQGQPAGAPQQMTPPQSYQPQQQVQQPVQQVQQPVQQQAPQPATQQAQAAVPPWMQQPQG